jgi:hypothetical protein
MQPVARPLAGIRLAARLRKVKRRTQSLYRLDHSLRTTNPRPHIMPPEEPFEARIRAMSQDLNEFRERRLADRRFQVRGTADRRAAQQPVPDDRNDAEQVASGRE